MCYLVLNLYIVFKETFLSIRLVANINAGHLILILCRGCCNEVFSLGLLENIFKLVPFFLGFINIFYLVFDSK